MKTGIRIALVTCSLALGATCFAGDAEPPRADAADPGPTFERIRELESKDPAGFRDLLRHSLAARLLWQARGEKLPADMPLDLAQGMTTPTLELRSFADNTGERR